MPAQEILEWDDKIPVSEGFQVAFVVVSPDLLLGKEHMVVGIWVTGGKVFPTDTENIRVWS